MHQQDFDEASDEVVEWSERKQRAFSDYQERLTTPERDGRKFLRKLQKEIKRIRPLIQMSTRDLRLFHASNVNK